MIYNWKTNKEEALKNGICETKVMGVTRIVMNNISDGISHHTFIGFEQLEFEEGTTIADCVFENCRDISFEECSVKNCTFKNIDTVFSVHSDFDGCKFRNLVCCNDNIITLEDSEMNGCSFEDIELRNDSYLCDGVGDSWIEQCSFFDIRSSRDDREIIICEERSGRIFRHKKQFCIVDESTCEGLDCIAGLVEA